jgi:hypothetical protein
MHIEWDDITDIHMAVIQKLGLDSRKAFNHSSSFQSLCCSHSSEFGRKMEEKKRAARGRASRGD